ncbi:uncharacterized protein G2W53_026416 [Senna tora]|uniref:Uncharacterized protein n=1 Tax=Senna tora TaxID=362788 RepID=A0A834TH55_9FABA|nr:uncharacterized protein G2W53_026416 [Senna tora]
MQLSDSLTSIDQIVRKLEIEREEERRRVLHGYTLCGGLRRRVGGEAESQRSGRQRRERPRETERVRDGDESLRQ